MVHNPPRVLVIDDEPAICHNCMKILERMDVDTDYSLNGIDALQKMEHDPFDILVTDLKMSRMGGMEVLRQVKESYPNTLVIVITGYASVSSAVEVMKLGAFDYLPKPFTPEELRSVVRNALAHQATQRQNRILEQQRDPVPAISHQLIGESPKIRKVVEMVRKVAPTDSTVLIYGESGTGKELIARAIHANSGRRDRVFFAVDCGTLSGELLESELFGHMKGAFTGAHQDKEGIFRQAEGGTVFLDEISNISTEIQAKLLRFMESREFLPVGSVSPVSVDVRLIFATNRELQQMVERGEFRSDFYYRIFVYPIMVPPLRERKEDILPIAHYFLRQFAQRLGAKISGFTAEAVNSLIAKDWPGNVRQLRNVIERAVILCEGDRIGLAELPRTEELGVLIDQVPSTNKELIALKKEIRQKAVSQVEKNFLLNALMENNWNIAKAARKTGLQRSNFQLMMRKHGIRRPRK